MNQWNDFQIELERIDQAEKNWKFSLSDAKERIFWDDYMKAYEAVLENTSTRWAPWYLVPSNHAWFRDLVVCQVLVEALEGLNMSYPPPAADLKAVKIR